MDLFVRDLKYVRFQLDREKKEITLLNKQTNESVTFNKVYTFSLFRFLVSAAQKMTVIKRRKK